MLTTLLSRSKEDSQARMDPDSSAAVANAVANRWRLPPLDSLRAFEAAARRLSFTAAAEELCVTQGAISQRIKALEYELRVSLFRRLPRRLELTPDGERLARGVRQGLDNIISAIGAIDRQSGAGVLTVSVLPSFARRWLMPRLPRFRDRYPEIEVQILAEGCPVDLAQSGLDAALRFGHGAYPGLHATQLMGDSVVPVCSPEFLARRGPIRSVDDLLALPLIHDTTTETDHSNSDWRSWLIHIGAGRHPPGAGLRFDQADLVVDAAVLGLGAALARTSLVAGELASGQLVRALPHATPTAFSYYLLCRPQSATCPRVSRFREWLVEESQPRVQLETQHAA
jgi:LysR family transcriptional regulator, glycine cleavage system transcriptional activator